METVSATYTWAGPHTGVLTLFAEPPPDEWIAEPDDLTEFFVWWVVASGRETDQIAAVEMLGFLDFDRWDTLPNPSSLWQLPDWPPLPLRSPLQRLQAELRAREHAAPAQAPVAPPA